MFSINLGRVLWTTQISVIQKSWQNYTTILPVYFRLAKTPRLPNRCFFSCCLCTKPFPNDNSTQAFGDDIDTCLSISCSVESWNLMDKKCEVGFWNVWVGDNRAGASQRMFLFLVCIPSIAVTHLCVKLTTSEPPGMSDSMLRPLCIENVSATGGTEVLKNRISFTSNDHARFSSLERGCTRIYHH